MTLLIIGIVLMIVSAITIYWSLLNGIANHAEYIPLGIIGGAVVFIAGFICLIAGITIVIVT